MPGQSVLRTRYLRRYPPLAHASRSNYVESSYLNRSPLPLPRHVRGLGSKRHHVLVPDERSRYAPGPPARTEGAARKVKSGGSHPALQNADRLPGLFCAPALHLAAPQSLPRISSFIEIGPVFCGRSRLCAARCSHDFTGCVPRLRPTSAAAP